MGEVFGVPTLYLHLSGDRHPFNIADIRTTQRYVHPDTDSMIRAAEVIDFPIDVGAPRQSA